MQTTDGRQFSKGRRFGAAGRAPREGEAIAPVRGSRTGHRWLLAPLQALMLAIVLVAGAAPALATYPGQNGRIAFHRFDPSTGLAYALYTANPDGSHVV